MTASGCENCFFRRREFVGGRGNPAAPVVFVGESPGAVEMSKGRPFEGPSGKVLEDCLPDTMSLDDYYVINAIGCMPRRTDDVNKNMSDTQSACRACHNRLVGMIKEHPRKVIVALGNGALWSLTNNYSLKITHERGRLFHSDLAERGIVASVHPAFLLRGGGSYRKFKQDIEYALDLANGAPEKKPIIPEWIIAENDQDVRDFIDETFLRGDELQDDILGADLETGGFNFRQDEILSLGWCVDPKLVYIVPDKLITPENLKYRQFSTPAMKGGPFKWMWHNGKFDIKFMHTYKLDSGVDHDSMLMSYTMEERRGYHDLEQVAQDEIGAPDYKDMLKPYLPKKDSSYRVIPKRVLYKYQALDVSNTKQAGVRMLNRLHTDKNNTKLYYKVLLPASDLLTEIETTGMLVDFTAVEKNAIYYQNIMQVQSAIIDAESAAVGGPAINPNSPAQLSRLLYDDLKLSAKVRGTSADVLDGLPNHPAVTALKEYRKAAKAYGTYVKSLHEQVFDDGRVHSTYLLHGTPTGRLASRGPNMQNQPRGPRIRGQFIAPEGRMFCEMDLDQAELRCLAALSQDNALCAIYEQGRKIHKEVSIDLWGQDWVRRYALDAPGNPEYDQAKEEYMRTKALNFGIIYGREAPSIAAEFGITRSEAVAMVEGWARKFPTAWDYIQRCRMAPVRGQNLLTPFGRRKRAGVVSREHLRDLQNEAANFPHQSIASDITLMSAVRVRENLKRWDAKIVNLIHDAILVELPDDIPTCIEMAKHVTGVMRQVPVDWGITRIAFKADAKVSNNWGLLKDLEF